MALRLYECPPLEARLTHRACLANRRRAKEAVRRRGAIGTGNESAAALVVRAVVWLKPCRTCPGVKTLHTKGITGEPTDA